MAKKWLIGHALIALNDKKNLEGRRDIARRFPLFATATDSDILEALNKFPYMTVRKVERALGGKYDADDGMEDDEEDEDEE